MRIVGAGAGGHAKVVLEIVLADGSWEPVGLTDPRNELHGTTVLGVPVIGDDSLLERCREDGVRHAFLGLGGTRDNGPRRRLYEQLVGLGYEPIVAVHGAAVVSRHARVGAGTSILAAAVVNPGAELGVDVIVNTGALVEHDCVIGDHVHLATGCRLSGAVEVGEGAHVGAGATVRQGIRIGAGAIVGVGAAVVDDVPASVTVVGVPARPLAG